MITDKLKELVATYIQGTAMNKAKIGQGGNSTSPAATTLDVPLTTTTSVFNAIKSGDNVIEVQAVFQGSSASMTGKVIREFRSLFLIRGGVICPITTHFLLVQKELELHLDKLMT